jgi:hypothetical protein
MVAEGERKGRRQKGIKVSYFKNKLFGSMAGEEKERGWCGKGGEGEGNI